MYVLDQIVGLSIALCIVWEIQGCLKETFILASKTTFQRLCMQSQHFVPDQSNRSFGDKENCTFIIKAPVRHIVMLRLEYSGDYIEIRDGRQRNSRYLGSYAGPNAKDSFVKSTGQYVRATFFSAGVNASSNCSYGSYKVIKQDSPPKDKLKKPKKEVVAWFLGITVFSVVCVVALSWKYKIKHRDTAEHNNAAADDEFIAEFELPNYESQTTGLPAQNTIAQSCAEEVDSRNSGEKNKSYFVYARSTKDFITSPNYCLPDDFTNASQEPYLVRVSRAYQNRGPPPTYLGSYHNNDQPPSYENN